MGGGWRGVWMEGCVGGVCGWRVEGCVGGGWIAWMEECGWRTEGGGVWEELRCDGGGKKVRYSYFYLQVLS